MIWLRADTRSAQAGELRPEHKAAAMKAQMALRRTSIAPQQGQQSAGAALRPAVSLAPVPASRCFQKRSNRAASRGGLRSGSLSAVRMLTQLHAPHSSGRIRPWGPHIVVQRRPAQHLHVGLHNRPPNLWSARAYTAVDDVPGPFILDPDYVDKRKGDAATRMPPALCTSNAYYPRGNTLGGLFVASSQRQMGRRTQLH